MTEYTPNDGDVRWQYVVKRILDGATRTHAGQEYTRWLAAHDARVRRDAAREALDGLAAAERRIARLEAQSDIRGRAVVMYRERARDAEARIEAVQALIDHADQAGAWAVTCTRLQWAVDGTPAP